VTSEVDLIVPSSTPPGEYISFYARFRVANVEDISDFNLWSE